MKRSIICLLLLSLTAASLFAQQATSHVAQTRLQVIDSGRIFNNPPFQSCHAATVVETGKDTLLYAWFAGDYEGADNVAIWGCYRYTNQQDQWGKLLLLAEGKDSTGNRQACWNPVLFKTFDGALFLDYKVGRSPREWWAERKTSYNNGKTWSSAKRLLFPLLGPIKNKPVQLNNGTILYPSSTESLDEKSWQIHLESTDRKGDHWKYIPIDSDGFGVIQPSILQYGGDTLQMLCRSRQNAIVQTWSYDNGLSWSPLTPLGLPNPNSGIDAVTLHNGLQLLVYNPLLSGKDWWMGRAVLKVAISKNGADWKEIATLEEHPKGEFSYPAVIQDSRHIIRIAYTDDRKNIKFADLK